LLCHVPGGLWKGTDYLKTEKVTGKSREEYGSSGEGK
jgi:hypothetical protein